MPNFEPRFEARPSAPHGDNGWWSVHVFLNDEKPIVIVGFSNQYDALDWIKNKSANWFADYIMQNAEY
jgi:hypothetical protein